MAQCTKAGTAGAVATARRSDAVLLASRLTAAASARHICQLSPAPPLVALLAMVYDGRRGTADDDACADYLEALLTGGAYDHATALQWILATIVPGASCLAISVISDGRTLCRVCSGTRLISRSAQCGRQVTWWLGASIFRKGRNDEDQAVFHRRVLCRPRVLHTLPPVCLRL